MTVHSTDSGFVLRNGNLELTVDRATGSPGGFVHLGKSVEWSGRPGRLEIIDCLSGRFDARESASDVSAAPDGPDAMLVQRRFRGAEWAVRERFTAEEDAVRWDVEVVPDEGSAERGIVIRQTVPWPRDVWGWRAWSANYRFPTMARNLGGTSLEYGGQWYGTVIPAVSVYDPAQDIGLSVAKPLGLRTPRLTFRFSDYFGEGITVENDLLGLRGRPVRVSILLRCHEGCFRPALAWLLAKYPEYFLPPNPGVRQLEGAATFGPAQVTDEDADKLRDRGVKWYEIHHSFPYFGEYCPEAGEWGDGSRLGRPNRLSPTTREVIDECGRRLAERGISALLYMQVAGDTWLPFMEERFPESLARNTDGGLFRTLRNCALANSDPSLPFGREMQRQVRGVLDRYPHTAGVFLDQAFYNGIDTAHDDGSTMYENRPAYRLRYCFDAHLPELCRGLHERGKFIYSNAPHDIELQKDMDGNMAENTTVSAASLKYMHLAKPLLLLPYYKDDWDVEEMFRQCLLAGASWAVWTITSQSWYIREEISREQERIFRRYVPLCSRLLGRRILLDPNPVRFPKPERMFSDDLEAISEGDGKDWPNEWEAFYGENGEILVSLINRGRSCLDAGAPAPLSFSLHVRDAGRISRAYALGADYKGEQPVETAPRDGGLSVTIPRHGAASLVVFELER